MTDRVLLCIGVNQYDDTNLTTLSGAEADAQNIFNILTDAGIGAYDVKDSILLLSPTLPEVRQALDALAGLKPVDTFTFFFAGHGGVSAGSYYLCLKNSSPQRFSTSALGMPELLSVINELSPQECNIIIDACEAGGVTVDLHTIIKPEILGASASPSVSILCSSSADQVAGDTPTGGIGTIEIINAINGTTAVDTSNEYLDLVAIGRTVSAQMIEKRQQRPVVWGLNLSGKSRFSKNPGFTATPAPAALASRIPAGSEAHKIIKSFSERLLVLNLRQPEEIDVESVHSLLSEVAKAFSAAKQETMLPKFINGFALSLVERVRQSRDVFAPVEVLATCGSLLIGLPQNQDVLSGQEELSKALLRELDKAFDWLATELTDTSLCDSGWADLYLIPLRVTRILGWASVYMGLAERFDPANREAVDTARFVVNTMISLFPCTFSAVCDEQTPYLLAFMSQAIQRGWIEEAEFIFGGFFSSFHHVKGNITSADIPEDKIAEYIFCRGRNDGYSKLDYSVISKPSEMFALLMALASMLKLEDMSDPHLEGLDHLTFNVFIPEFYKGFALSSIPSGKNHTYQIGHQIWTVADFAAHLPALKKEVFADAAIGDLNMQTMCTCASFVFPDRSPWFLLLGI